MNLERWDVYWYDDKEWTTVSLADPVEYGKWLIEAGLEFILVPERDSENYTSVEKGMIDVIIEIGAIIFPTDAKSDSETNYEWEIRGRKNDGQELVVTS